MRQEVTRKADTMQEKIKKTLKHLLGYNDIEERNIQEKNSVALDNFLEEHPLYKEPIHTLGVRPDNKEFSPDIKKITDGFVILNEDLKKLEDDKIPNIFEYDGLHSGTPLRYKPFKGALRSIRWTLRRSNLYWYPNAEGSRFDRQKIVDYLKKEEIITNTSEKKEIGINNILFTYSTTHAFHLILKALLKDDDVVLMTGPNYGLFAVKPEIIGNRALVIPLEEEDNFLPNPAKLDKKIKEINQDLAKKYKGKEYIPRVKAFLNENPHNPLGKVMSKKDEGLLREIGLVCKNNGVFVIDDLIYRDLSYKEKALPMMSIPGLFNNTISLMGISKAYGLASLRAGFIFGPEEVIRMLANEIEESLDSMSVLQVAAVTGVFNGSKRREREAKRYLGKILKIYQYRLSLLEALIYGIDYIKDEKRKKKINYEIDKYIKNPEIRNYIKKGIPHLKLRDNTIPESGFFAIVDFTYFRGKKYNDSVISNDMDFIKFLYKLTKIKIIMGSNMSWPYEEEIIGRVNFGLDTKALINNFYIMKKALNKLK